MELSFRLGVEMSGRMMKRRVWEGHCCRHCWEERSLREKCLDQSLHLALVR